MAVVTASVITVFLVVILLMTISLQDKIVKHEDIKITEYNKNYVKDANLTLFLYNKTTQAFNGFVDLKRQVGFNDKANVTVYKMFNNHYQVYPVELKKSPCQLLEANKMGSKDIAKMLNISGCPISPAYYSRTNVVPDLTKYPLHLVPTGNYKIAVSLYDGNTYLGSGYWQGEVLFDRS